MERWAGTYLMIETNDYPTLSPVLSSQFSQQTASPVLDFYLKTIEKYTHLWISEEDVMHQVVRILSTLSKKSAVLNAMASSERFHALVSHILSHLSRMPASIQSPLVKYISNSVTHLSDPTMKETFFQDLVRVIEHRLIGIYSQAEFRKMPQNPIFMEHITSSIEMYTGLFMSLDESNSRAIFLKCVDKFSIWVDLLDIYHTCPEIEYSILSMFAQLAKGLYFDALSPSETQQLLQVSTELLKRFATHETGRKIYRTQFEEEEVVNDLISVLEFLDNLMTGLFEGLPRSDIIEKLNLFGPFIQVDQVLFYNLSLVLPLFTEHMLSFPALTQKPIHLVCHLMEYFPEKLSNLPPDVLGKLLHALEVGLESNQQDVLEHAFNALSELSRNIWSLYPSPATTLALFLDLQLDRLLTRLLFLDLRQEYLVLLYETLACLITARKNAYLETVDRVVSKQPSESREKPGLAFSNLNRELESCISVRENIWKGQPSLGMAGAKKFRHEWTKFLVLVRGFLRVK